MFAIMYAQTMAVSGLRTLFGMSSMMRSMGGRPMRIQARPANPQTIAMPRQVCPPRLKG